MDTQEMTPQEVFDMCLKIYGQALREYAKDLSTEGVSSMPAYLSMCSAQEQLWDAAKDLAK